MSRTMVNIMCPADEFTPSGVDCGLPIYIDRQLAGDFGRGAKRYSHGPWQQGKPQQGYQLPMTPEQHFKAGIEAANKACVAKYGKPFDQVAAADGNAFLNDLAAGKVSDPRLPMDAWFNELMYPLFTQACFADPVYGGNYNKVFWKMVGYPGLPATNTVNMVQYRGKPFPGAKDPKSHGRLQLGRTDHDQKTSQQDCGDGGWRFDGRSGCPPVDQSQH